MEATKLEVTIKGFLKVVKRLDIIQVKNDIELHKVLTDYCKRLEQKEIEECERVWNNFPM